MAWSAARRLLARPPEDYQRPRQRWKHQTVTLSRTKRNSSLRSYPRHRMVDSCQLDAPAALLPGRRAPRYCSRMLVGTRAGLDVLETKGISWCCRDSNPGGRSPTEAYRLPSQVCFTRFEFDILKFCGAVFVIRSPFRNQNFGLPAEYCC